jgi:hypothetical protein
LLHPRWCHYIGTTADFFNGIGHKQSFDQFVGTGEQHERLATFNVGCRRRKRSKRTIASLDLRPEQFAQMLVKLADRIGIGTEKRKVAIDGLNRPEFGIGN